MAVLTSTPNQENQVRVYDVPDDVLSQYEISGEKAAQMFPESGKPGGSEIPDSSGAMGVSKIENSENLGGDVEAYWHRVCVCRQLYCNAYSCWWHYYYCWC